MSQAEQLEALCTSCARCCNGKMFGATLLDVDERERFGVIGSSMPQPCSKLAGTRCTVYASRPRACSSFVCPAVTELLAGTLTLEQAKARAEQLGRK